MRNVFSFFLFLAVLAAFSTGLNAQMANKDHMATKGDDTMVATETMADKETMSAKEAMMAATPTVIRLSQVTGEYTTQSLRLAPGDYIFEVTNTEVDKNLGFYLQAADDSQVANSGLETLVGNGETSRTGVVTLTEGTYQYSCPLNPTPHYTVTVK